MTFRFITRHESLQVLRMLTLSKPLGATTDSMGFLTSHCDLDVCKKSHEHSVEDMLDYFTSLTLKLNADETVFIVFGKKNQPQSLAILEKNGERSSEISG